MNDVGPSSGQREIHPDRYQSEEKAKTIHFTLESSGGYSHHPPLEFTTHRVGE